MKTHAIHFFVLVAILVGGVFTFFSVQGNHALQLAVGILTSIAYVSWGIIHHTIQHDLLPKVVIEYCLLGAIAILLLVIIVGT